MAPEHPGEAERLGGVSELPLRYPQLPKHRCLQPGPDLAGLNDRELVPDVLGLVPPLPSRAFDPLGKVVCPRPFPCSPDKLITVHDDNVANATNSSS
jgi:hypothetical protein